MISGSCIRDKNHKHANNKAEHENNAKPGVVGIGIRIVLDSCDG
jgi:hypothetical protein